MLYHLGQQFAVQQQFAPAIRARGTPLPYLRPPFEVLLFWPLTYLSYTSAYIVGLLVSLAAAVAVPFLLRTELHALWSLPWWLLAGSPLLFTPIILTFVQGQDSVIVLFLYTLAYLAMRKQREFAAGCWLSLACFKPQLVLPSLLIFLLQGRKRMGLGVVVTFALLVGISAALVGSPALFSYPQYLWSIEHNTGRGLVLARDTPNLRGLLEGLLSAMMSARSVLLLVCLISALVLIWAARNPARNDPAAGDLLFCTNLSVAILVSYHLFAYDLAILLLPILLLINHLAELTETRPQSRQWTLLGPVIVVLLASIAQLAWMGSHFMYLCAPIFLYWVWSLKREIALHIQCAVMAPEVS